MLLFCWVKQLRTYPSPWAWLWRLLCLLTFKLTYFRLFWGKYLHTPWLIACKEMHFTPMHSHLLRPRWIRQVGGFKVWVLMWKTLPCAVRGAVTPLVTHRSYWSQPVYQNLYSCSCETGFSQHWRYPSKESKLCRICDNSLHSGSLKRGELKGSPNSLLTGRLMVTMRVWRGKRVWNWMQGCTS